MMDDKEITGGYDALFHPPLTEDFTCCICILAFREPMQLPCGHQYCRSCLEKCRRTQYPDLLCPVDREKVDIDKVFPDIAMQRKVLSLSVKCNNVKSSCDWSGELRALENHLTNCPFISIKCPNEGCPSYIPKVKLDDHLINECMFLLVECKYCMVMYLLKDSQDHAARCKHWPVQCINSCGEEDIPRQKMEEHLKVCPLSILPCTYVAHGCTFVGKMHQRERHEKCDVENHLKMTVKELALTKEKGEMHEKAALVRYNELDKKFEMRMNILEQQTCNDIRFVENKLKTYEIKENLAQEKVRMLEEKLQMLDATSMEADLPGTSGRTEKRQKRRLLTADDRFEIREVGPIERAYIEVEQLKYGVFIWEIDNYRHKLEEARISNSCLYSEPFYSAEFGYKVRLEAPLNGESSGKGTHLGLFIQVLKGPNDDVLQWPFPYKITLSILHQRDELKKKSLTFDPNVHQDDFKEQHYGKPTGVSNPGSGTGGIISHDDIEDNGFLCNDSIYLMCKLDINS